ncbi:MAG: glycoside hydrolase family 99-like domain-containing protein [Lachnospiraceae bacterium]|nr:glycoside hydrolase family 99-like domain-containing protein [Lachnospiraceae bacterium]
MKNENNQVRVLAFYLPQYHSFPENDAWWGKGFTEWTNVRKAEPLYRGHYQPQVPLGDDYYDLTDYSNMEKQMAQAGKSGIFGFCYYHYWFNGKLLMEKPLENMRDHDGEKLPYCLCWANEPWTRAWDGKDKEVLMPQVYGDEEEWEQHFQYLLTFFRDSFYLKENNAPVLVLYRSNSIKNCDKMAAYWDKRAREENFSGIYLVEEVNSFQNVPVLQESKAYLEYEPLFTVNHRRSFTEKAGDKIRTLAFNLLTGNRCVHVYDYRMVWRNILRRNEAPMRNKERFPGAFVRWDNTPRRGKDSIFYACASPKAFGRFMKKHLKRAEKNQSRYLFVNAWNEWGEGAYMEPDTRYGFAFLNALRRAKEDVGKSKC